MNRSLYELCCRYSDGELDISEYRRQRRYFIETMIKSGDQTQPLSDSFVGDVTQPKLTIPATPVVSVSNITIPQQPGCSDLQNGGEKQIKSGRSGFFIVFFLLILSAGLSFWIFELVAEPEPLSDMVENAVPEKTARRLVLVNMYLLLDQERWTTTDIDRYLGLLRDRSAADKDVLRSDSRYHQFLDSIHIYQVLAEADQDQPMVDKLRQMEQALRD